VRLPEIVSFTVGSDCEGATSQDVRGGSSLLKLCFSIWVRRMSAPVDRLELDAGSRRHCGQLWSDCRACLRQQPAAARRRAATRRCGLPRPQLCRGCSNQWRCCCVAD